MLAGLLTAGAVAIALSASPARAFHTVFDFTVDRFTVDGNVFGSLDGTPDLVDDMNDESGTAACT